VVRLAEGHAAGGQVVGELGRVEEALAQRRRMRSASKRAPAERAGQDLEAASTVSKASNTGGLSSCRSRL
jgi:hypothetical protein